MKPALTFLLSLLLTTAVAADNLPVERQIEIISDYMNISGDRESIPPAFNMSLSLPDSEVDDTLPPQKCGTWAAIEYVRNYNSLDKDLLLAMNAPAISVRPLMDYRYDSPGGHFKFHYNKSGKDAVWQATNDSDGDGVPNYVEQMADIFEDVYNHQIVELGYPVPPSDGTEGGDDRYDVYIQDLGGTAYGYTFPGENNIAPDTLHYWVTSYMMMDNDYQELTGYQNRPLDAVEVTAAHEFFHAIQFGIEAIEYEVFSYIVGGQTVYRAMPYWMEMSSVWMEEETYDDVNDYYYYLPYFYNAPYQSLQQFRDGAAGIHAYASGIFPIYLAEKYGPDVIREIWTKCADTLGATFLTAAGAVLDSITGDTMSWRKAVNEFAVWNFFVGNKADWAPDGVGFSERSHYPGFADDLYHVIQDYPQRLQLVNTPIGPDHNGAAYIKLDQLQAFQRYKYMIDVSNISGVDSLLRIDTTYWECTSYNCIEFDTNCTDPNPFNCCIDSVCVDSARVYDTRLGYDWVQYELKWCTDCEMKDTLGTVFSYLVDPNCSVDCETATQNYVGYDYVIEDSALTVYWALDDAYDEVWSFSYLYQSANDLTKFYIEDSLVTPAQLKPSPQSDSLRVEDPELLRSITAVVTPATTERLNYQFTGLRGTPRRVGVFIYDTMIDSLRQSIVDENSINLRGDILIAYPNPAVTENMDGTPLKISYRVPTDDVSSFVYTNPRLTMDIYNIAGDYVRFVDTSVSIAPNNIYNEEKTTIWEAEWDMKNGYGAEVASGVYIVLVRLYDEAEDGRLVLQKTTKVAVIR